MKLRSLAFALSIAGMGMVTHSAMAAISDDVIRMGFITDMSGVYADVDGPRGVEAIRMAIADAGGAINGKKIELLVLDHQNKADIAASKAREWFDQQKIDLLIGGSNSAVALALATVAAEKKKPFIAIGAGSSDLTNSQCSPYTIHYAYDTVAMARGTGSAVVKNGGKTWFFITTDYAFGHALERDTAAVVKASGGEVKGQVRVPLGASDFSSFLLQAQSSGAQILGLANAGGDTINSIKAANEFGLTPKVKMAGLLVYINDIHALGLKETQGMYLTDFWYWDANDENGTFSGIGIPTTPTNVITATGYTQIGTEDRNGAFAVALPDGSWDVSLTVENTGASAVFNQSVTVVPEPTSALLVMISALGFIARRRR